MMCAPFDLKDYLFGELTAAEREAVDRHLLTCSACHEEVAALDATRSAVLCMREEEPVRRIAFVSDKVFEPRWWQRLFASGPQVGFASAAMLALAIVFHAVQSPATAVAPAPVAQIADQKAIDAEIDRRVAIAVQKVSSELEARQAEKLLQAVNARVGESERRYQAQMSYVAQYIERMQQRATNVRRASYETGVSLQ
ncbi:MAG TPA: zf-HC2 domain-containing protein [Bryobacteraceae bacterium]|nr:zf-HC2 domain-containing protein [Bryobacteraceae bacterium]